MNSYNDLIYTIRLRLKEKLTQGSRVIINNENFIFNIIDIKRS